MTTVLALIAALLVAQPLTSVPELGTDDVPVTLKDLTKQLRSKELSEREQAVTQIAALGKEDPAEPRKDAAEALAKVVKEDESYALRGTAVRELAKGQHQEVAVKTLTASVVEIQKELAKVGRGGRGGRGGGGRGGEENPEQAAEREETRTKMRFAAAVVEGLGQLPDDRSVKALVSLLGRLPRGASQNIGQIIVDSLLELEARAGIKAVIDDMVQTQARESSRAGRNNDRQGRDRGARGGGGNKAVHGELLRLAKEYNVVETPGFGDDVAIAWQKWFNKYGRKFPAKLGKIKVGG